MLSPLSRPAPGRAVGTGLSALLHLAAVAVIIFGLPDFKRPAESATVIPVEFLTLPPQPEPAPPPSPPEPKIAEAPPQKPTTPPPAPPPALENIQPDKPDQPDKGEAAPQEAKRTDKSDDGVEKPKDSKTKVIGRWLLDPLTVTHTGHPCGDATENGTLELIGERGPGAYHGTLRTHVHWTRCPPQVASYYVELRIKGNEVLMVGSGFADEGTKNGDVMRLRDAYGVSIWRRQNLPEKNAAGARQGP